MSSDPSKDRVGAGVLGLDPASDEDDDLFTWLVAYLLFGTRIRRRPDRPA